MRQKAPYKREHAPEGTLQEGACARRRLCFSVFFVDSAQTLPALGYVFACVCTNRLTSNAVPRQRSTNPETCLLHRAVSNALVDDRYPPFGFATAKIRR